MTRHQNASFLLTGLVLKQCLKVCSWAGFSKSSWNCQKNSKSPASRKDASQFVEKSLPSSLSISSGHALPFSSWVDVQLWHLKAECAWERVSALLHASAELWIKGISQRGNGTVPTISEGGFPLLYSPRSGLLAPKHWVYFQMAPAWYRPYPHKNLAKFGCSTVAVWYNVVSSSKMKHLYICFWVLPHWFSCAGSAALFLLLSTEVLAALPQYFWAISYSELYSSYTTTPNMNGNTE